MEIQRLADTAAKGYTTFGSMWERGSVKRNASFSVKYGDKEEILQSRVTAFWPDGSVKWAAHVVDAEKIGDVAEVLPVLNQDDAEGAKDTCNVKESESSFDITAGKVSLSVP